MRKITFSFRGATIGSKRTETIEVEDDITDKELDEMLSDWLWENSDANWYEEEK